MFLGCRPTLSGQVGVEGPVEAAPDIKEFVHRTYIHGVPYEDATRYGPENVPVLLAMLKDRNEESSWSNIVVTLCIAGDQSVAKPVIEFIEKGPSGDIADKQYAAKSSAVMALGFLINKTGSREALEYLKQSVDPEVWTKRKIEWKAVFQPTVKARNTQLSTMAVLGLALSGNPDAGDVLRNLRLAPATDAVREFGELMADSISDALKDHQTIATEGLREYYRKLRR